MNFFGTPFLIFFSFPLYWISTFFLPFNPSSDPNLLLSWFFYVNTFFFFFLFFCSSSIFDIDFFVIIKYHSIRRDIFLYFKHFELIQNNFPFAFVEKFSWQILMLISISFPYLKRRQLSFITSIKNLSEFFF